MGIRNPWLPYTGHLPITTEGYTPDFGAQMIDFVTSAYYTADEAMESAPILSYQPPLMDSQDYYGDFSSDGNAFFYAGTMLQPYVGTADAATKLLRVCDSEGRAALAYLRDSRVANSYSANIVELSTMDAGYNAGAPPFTPPSWDHFSVEFDPLAYRVGPPIFDLLNPVTGPGDPSGPCARLRVHQATGGFAIHSYDNVGIADWLKWGARYVMDADFYRTGAMGGYGVYMCNQDDFPGDVYNAGWAIESAMPIAPSSWVNISRGYNLRIGAVKNHLSIRLWGLTADPAAEQSLYFDNLRVRRLTMGSGLGTSMTGVMVAGSREGSGSYGHWLDVETGFTFNALRTLQVFELRR